MNMDIMGWIVLVVFGIVFLAFVFLLSRKAKSSANADEYNAYGVEKATGKDKLFKKLSIIMIIVAIICAALCVVGSYLDAYDDAVYEYEEYNSEDRLDKAQEWLDRAEYKLNKKNCSYEDIAIANSYGHEAERYMYPGDSPKDYLDWSFYDVAIDVDSIVPISIIGLLGILFPLYMFPTKIARKKVHEQTTAITWLNAIFGCTVIFWIAMLIWANSEKKSVQTIPQEASLTDKLDELKKLQEQGLLTEEEFEAKKKQILGI